MILIAVRVKAESLAVRQVHRQEGQGQVFRVHRRVGPIDLKILLELVLSRAGHK